MNSLEILNILKSDAFTKTVFTDVLPSDRLPGRIQTKPRGFIVNTDLADKPGTHWQYALFFALHRCRHIPM